mmetsp:Transcript_4351/g.4116  ORF Transcript_4351/g.4116 Transcript_4351/m.4116 type:complete len:91 (-) Transcript_4351:230-502(-)
MGEILLFLLQSRKSPNISQTAVSAIDESQDYSSFSGFFKNSHSKQLFDIMVKHLLVCIKKKVAQKKDCEVILAKALINFNCSASDFAVVK